MQIAKANIFGLDYAVTDYQKASEQILTKALERVGFSVFALPVHGVIERRINQKFRAAANSADMIVPDGQPIRWAMNYFHKTELADRVYGPKLMEAVLAKANEQRLRVFLYGGSTPQVLENLKSYIKRKFPNVQITGSYREENFGEHTIYLERLRA